jgi:hypothetical protein
MRKKKGGNPKAVNPVNSSDFALLSRSQQDDAIKATLSPNVLVNNLVQSLSNCGPTQLSATNGCQDYEFNKNAVNYLYLQNIRGGKLNKMNQRTINILMEGGCYTCPKGKRRLVAFSRTFVVIIPSLYNKFKKRKMQDFDKTVKKLTKSDEKPKKKSKKGKKLTAKRKKGGSNFLDLTNIDNLDFSYKEYNMPNTSCVRQYTSLTSPLV